MWKIAILLGLVFCIQSQNLRIKINNLTVKVLRKEIMMDNVTCVIVGDKYLSGQWMLRKTLHKIDTRVDINFLQDDGRNYNLLNVTVDMCRVIGKKSRNRLLNIGYMELQNKSNIECPALKNKQYFIRNFTVKQEYLFSFTPSFRFSVLIDILTDKKPYVRIQFIGSIEKM